MLCPNTTKQKHHGYGHSQGWSSAGTLYSTDTVECGNPFTCTREGVQDFLLFSIFCHVPLSKGLEFLTTKILKLESLFLAVNYRKKNNALLKSSGSMVLCNITKSVYILNIWNQPTSTDKNSEEYQRWRADHNNTCKANFICSAPAMEPERVDRIFRRFQASYLPVCGILWRWWWQKL